MCGRKGICTNMCSCVTTTSIYMYGYMFRKQIYKRIYILVSGAMNFSDGLSTDKLSAASWNIGIILVSLFSTHFKRIISINCSSMVRVLYSTVMHKDS